MFSANGFYFDFASLHLGIAGTVRLPEELMSVTFGDGITRPDIEGTGQIPIGTARGRYKCDNLAVKMTLEAYAELTNGDGSPLNVDGFGNVILPEVILTLQQEGTPEFRIVFHEVTLIKQPFNMQQNDASLGLTVEFKVRYMTINDKCLGTRNRSAA